MRTEGSGIGALSSVGPADLAQNREHSAGTGITSEAGWIHSAPHALHCDV